MLILAGYGCPVEGFIISGSGVACQVYVYGLVSFWVCVRVGLISFWLYVRLGQASINEMSVLKLKKDRKSVV